MRRFGGAKVISIVRLVFRLAKEDSKLSDTN